MNSPIRPRHLQPSLIGWLLACTLVLPSLIGWLPMPMRVQSAFASAAATTQDATARLLADLAVLCTPYGLRLASHDQPAKPAGKVAHDTCVLCGLAAAAAFGVVQQSDALSPPAQNRDPLRPVAQTGNGTVSTALPPPGRGPPN